MKTEQITILTRSDRYSKEYALRSIEGYTDPTFPGLAVHRGIEYEHDFWYVTHLKSGYSIHSLPFDKRKQAVLYATEAAKVVDWTRDAEAVLDQHPDRTLIKAYTKAIAV